MRTLARLSLVVLVSLAVAGVPDAAEAKRRGSRARCKAANRVRVKGRTPLRRGPGLNYGVASFLEKATCAPYSEVSLDEQWVLIEVDRAFGWVPVKRLTKRSQEKLEKKGMTGPIGSGQARGTARLIRQSVLLERPDPRAPVRRVMPENLRVLPLAVTREGAWTQVRDERGDVGWMASADLVGDTLAQLPRTETRGVTARALSGPAPGGAGRAEAADGPPAPPPGPGADAKAAAAPGGGRVVAVRPAAKGPLGLRFVLFGAALNPVHSLDSNGEDGLRRYDLSAVSAGTGLEVELQDLGPVGVRVGYTIAFMSGVSADDVPGTGEAGGLQHDAYARVGLPLALGGSTWLSPELGYHFGMFDFDSVLAGQRQVVFLSTQSHTGSLGVRLQTGLLDGLTFDADVGVLLGVTQESPRDLGEAGLTAGVAAQGGIRWLLGSSLSLVVRYAVNYRTTGYSGEAQLDPSITEATLVDLSHGLLAGVAFDL